MKTTPFWIDDFPYLANVPGHPLPDLVDVAIVGGGYTGLSAGRTLALNGVSVAVLEQRQIGGGASAINGGQIAPGTKLGIRAVFKKYGPDLGREIWDATVEAVRSFERFIAAENIDCDYTGQGGVAWAYRPSHYRHLAEDAEWIARELNFNELELIPPEQMHTEIGSDVFHGGLLEKMGGGVHPARYLYGLACAAHTAGATLCQQTEVQTITRPARGGKFYLKTNRGVLCAERVLLATNGYTGPLVRQVQRRVFPVGSYMITTAPLPESLQQELIPNNRVMFDTKWFLNYFRLTPDGRMSMGGRNNLSPNLDWMDSARNLQKTTLRIFPQLRGVPLTHTWGGRLGITFDLMPHIGQVNDVYYAFGYGGHGVALSAYLGREAARLMTGQLDRSPFADISHLTSPFYQGQPWFLPLASAYYGLLDRLS